MGISCLGTNIRFFVFNLFKSSIQFSLLIKKIYIRLTNVAIINSFGPVWFLFLKTVLENIILVLSENCFYSLNLVFSMFSVFFRTKKKRIKRVPYFFLVLVLLLCTFWELCALFLFKYCFLLIKKKKKKKFSLFLFFKRRKLFSKTITKQALYFFFSIFSAHKFKILTNPLFCKRFKTKQNLLNHY